MKRPRCEACGRAFDPPKRPQGGGRAKRFCSTKCRVAHARSDGQAKCPHCWQTAVNTTDPAGYKFRICQGCGYQLADDE